MTDLQHPVKLASYEEFAEWFKTIVPLDEYGFYVRQELYWLPEPPQDELARIEFNLAAYEQFLICGSRFPIEIKAAREKEFHRARVLRERLL
jgi:hypothetical protein